MRLFFLGVFTIWRRDFKRYLIDKSRVFSSVVQPVLYLFILGNGMGSGLAKTFSRGQTSLVPGVNYIQFLYPGIVCMSILFTSIFSAVSIVWDREFGFLKEVLVSPIPRSAVAVGKALGGTTIAFTQALLMLLFAPLVGVHLAGLQLLKVLAAVILISFSLTSLGIAIAARMRSMEGFQMIMNFLVFPMFLLSGAMFPLKGLPEWLSKLVTIDPLTYGVDLLRGIMLGSHKVTVAGEVVFQVPNYPLLLDLAFIALFGLVMVTLAVWQFGRVE